MRLKKICKMMIAVIIVAALIFTVNNYRSSQRRKVPEYEQNQATNAYVSDYKGGANEVVNKKIENKAYLPEDISIDYSQFVESYEEINYSNTKIDHYQVETITIELQ